MNKQSTKGNSNEEKMTELYCRHLFHPRVPASSKFLPGMVANLNSPLSSCVKIIRKICLYIFVYVSVTQTLCIFLCVTLYFAIDKIENLLMLPSPEMLKIIKMSVTRAAH